MFHVIPAAVEYQDQTTKQSRQGEGRYEQSTNNNRKAWQKKDARETQLEIQNTTESTGPAGHSRGTHQQMGRSQGGHFLEEGLRRKQKLKVPSKRWREKGSANQAW